MRSNKRSPGRAFTGLAVVYMVCAGFLFYLLPNPREEFDFMVIGTGSTAVTMAAVFAGCVFKTRR